MSSPKSQLSTRVKISKTGRPYVEVKDLVNSELERLKHAKNGSHPAEPAKGDADQKAPTGNGHDKQR